MVGAFCMLVEHGETPPLAVLKYLADALRVAMGDAQGDPAKVDPRKALGLVRARAGNPHSKALLTPDQAAEFAASAEDLPVISFDREVAMRKRYARERNIDVGVALEDEFVRQLGELARGEPSLVNGAMAPPRPS